MSLQEHIERLLAQDYDETELYARLRALLTLWDYCEKDGDVRK